MTTTSTQRTSTRHDRGFVSLLLITAGGLMLAGQQARSREPTPTWSALPSCSASLSVSRWSLFSWWLDQPQQWAWITAIATGAIGAGLLSGLDRAASVVGWAIPVVLTIAGLAVAAHWLRAR
jgi:hypothetical protein